MTDTAQNTALTVHEGGQDQPRPAPTPKTPLMAGATPQALVPVDFDGAFRIANVVHRAGMAPASLDSLEKVMVAILHGLEVGLTPMNALQSIAVINGRPTIWGDGAVGLIRASGKLEYMKEFYENEDTPTMKAVCIVKRKGETEPVRTDFSMADAKKADLLGKKGPWQTYPKRMLKMRARWALRDTFADVLKGLRLREEEEDLARQEAPAVEAQPERRRVPPPPPAEATEAAAPAEAAKETEVVDEATGEVTSGPAEASVTHSDATVGMESTGTVAKRDPISTGTAEGFPGDTKMVTKPADDGEIPWQLDRKLSDNDREWLMELKVEWGKCGDLDEIISVQESYMKPAHEIVSAYVWKKASDLMDDYIERVQRG